MGFFVYSPPHIVGKIFLDLDMNWLKKPASPMVRNIALGVMAIGVIVMILIGDYLISLGFGLITLSLILTKMNKTK